MSLVGSAAIAMWWNMAPDLRSEFEDWHSHEHFPERMSIPGFRRGSIISSSHIAGDLAEWLDGRSTSAAHHAIPRCRARSSAAIRVLENCILLEHDYLPGDLVRQVSNVAR
jgi:hypothetical protein